MAVALLAKGDREDALCTFDRAFHDCEPQDIRFLLLLKSILVFESGNKEEGIARAEYLSTTANGDNDDEATYLYTQVLGAMYLKKGSYGRAIPLIERAKSLAPKDEHCPPNVFVRRSMLKDVQPKPRKSSSISFEHQTRKEMKSRVGSQTSPKNVLRRLSTLATMLSDPQSMMKQ
ncbi:hypothetical protein M404DRAFT_540724 [Pisolithus tinctorius Marx 270]|uniref:Uncharacterized protein n=1 Tax=Pisolithus tinctorius Marx 270 TaxID=870435 RepID=A0A0C3K5F3_PISTI|nr:hypothetical protein M404DRAFT_540724 [Pisolithus tinctorius Marx 270]